MQVKDRTPIEVQRDGFSALVDQLGMADAIRFIQQFEIGEGDYTAERHKWLGHLTVDEIVREIRHMETERPASGSENQP